MPGQLINPGTSLHGSALALTRVATEEKIADVPIAEKEDVEAAVAAAKAAQPAWEAVPAFTKVAFVKCLSAKLIYRSPR
jgi:lactaldehyde dehydrogenase/glycolaldehyde dehydrogenase